MGVFDKILGAMKLGDEEYDEEYDEEEVVKEMGTSNPSIFSQKKSFEDVNIDDKAEKKSFFNSKKVTPINSRKNERNKTMEVCVFKPSSFDDAREIGETLLSGQTVILNMEGVDVALAQRIVDFSSGACFALEGNLQKVSNFMFLITPHNVGISGDIEELVNNFDFNSIKTGF